MEELNQMEINKLNNLQESLFYPQYLFHVSFRTFEKYFKEISNKVKINLFNVFTEIAESHKKYITYNGLYKAYLKYKSNKTKKFINQDLFIFFDTIFNSDLIEEKSCAENQKDCSNDFSQIKISFSDTNNQMLENILKNACKIEIMMLKDKSKIIKGIIIQYDNNNKLELNSKELKYDILLEKNPNSISNESFSIINDNNYYSIIMNLNKDMAKQIFENNNNNIISFLGFKCVSDKLKNIYLPNGERCSFETFCNKFSFFKIKTEENYNIICEKKTESEKNKIEVENNKSGQYISFQPLENNPNLSHYSKEKILHKIEVSESELRKHTNSKTEMTEDNYPTVGKDSPKVDLNTKSDDEDEINKEIEPKLFLKKKYYKFLKGRLTNIIHEHFYNDYHYNSSIPAKILNELVPAQISEREDNNKKEEIQQKNKIIKLNGNEVKIDDKNESEEYEHNNKDNNQDNTNETIINSDANELWKDIGYDSIKALINTKRHHRQNDGRERNKQDYIENWRYLSEHLRRKFGINLFKTIRRIILALNTVNKDDFEQYDLKEKIEIYQTLTNKDNERIIKFISNVLEKKDKINKTDLIIEKVEKSINRKKGIKRLPMTKIFNLFVGEKNFYIEKIIKKKSLKAFLCYRRKRQSIIEDSNFNWSVMKIKIRNYKERQEKKNISKLNTFHGQDDIDEESDPNFPSNKSSLCPLEDNKVNWKLPNKVLSSDISGWECIKWKKIENTDIFCGDDSLNIDNIRQGEYLGDCYFLSALGTLCNITDHLNKMIHVIRARPNKTLYSVKLNLHGKWKYVLIDNFLPFVSDSNGSNHFCFGSSFKKELWVSLFEKAWAKINGCYARIGCGGKCYEAFDVLTGAYSEIIKIRDIKGDANEILWNKLKDAKDNNYEICAGTRQLGLFENVGLVSSHAYSVINIYYLNYEGKIIKLIKLRNPWGEKEFTGQWSDNSLIWNDELKRLVSFDGIKDEGIFYMSYEDFIGYFSTVEILKIKNGYETIASCKIKKSEAHKCQIIRFEIQENQKHLFISLYQKNPRIIRKNGTYFPEPVKAFIILAKQIGFNKFTYINSISDSKAHLGLEANLEKGKYYIFCDVNYRFVYDEIYGYNITIYSAPSEYEIKLENITDNFNGKKRAEKLNSVIFDYFEQNEKDEKKITKVETFKDIGFYRSAKFNEDFPFIFFILKNPKEKKGIYFSSKLMYNNTKNCCIYNNSEVSEFDNFFLKEINEKYTVVLFMGYELIDKFSIQPKFYETKQAFTHFIFDYENTSEDENFKYYISFIERKKGYIFGIKKINDKVIEKINFKVIGMNIIDPKYNDGNNDIYFNISKKGETKVFNLRLKPDCELFDYFINY